MKTKPDFSVAVIVPCFGVFFLSFLAALVEEQPGGPGVNSLDKYLHQTSITAIGRSALALLIMCIGSAYIYRWLIASQYTEANRSPPRFEHYYRALPTMLFAVFWYSLLGFLVYPLPMLFLRVIGFDYSSFFELTGVGSYLSMLFAATLLVGVAVREELIFRVVIFKYCEEKMGTVLALLLQGTLFGLIHLLKPETPLFHVFVASVVGLTLGAVYVASRSILVPIALHFGLDFAGLGIFGSFDQGRWIQGLLIQDASQYPVPGSNLEMLANLPTLLLLVLTCVSLIVRQRHQLVPSPWSE